MSPQLIDPLVANTAFAGTGQALDMHGSMVGVAALVGLLGAISLLLLVIGHRQQRVEQGARA